jgi:hypothetical protein
VHLYSVATSEEAIGAAPRGNPIRSASFSKGREK